MDITGKIPQHNVAPDAIGDAAEQPAEGRRSPSDAEVALFDRLAGPTDTPAPAAPAPPETPLPPVETAQPSGNAILAGLGQLHQAMATKMEAVERAAGKRDLEVGDLIQLQLKTHEVVMDQTLIGKAAHAGSDAVNSLLKGQ